MEDLATQYNNEYEELQFKKVVIRHVPRNVLLKPADAEAKLHTQTFKLGDRVVYALDAGAVPLATRGTVVGVQEKVVDVVFDTTFMGGKNLEGRCSDFRGLALPYASVINLSYPAFAVHPESGSDHPPPPPNKGRNFNKDHNNSNHHGGGYRPRAPNGPNTQHHQGNNANGHHNSPKRNHKQQQQQQNR